MRPSTAIHSPDLLIMERRAGRQEKKRKTACANRKDMVVLYMVYAQEV